MSPFYSFIWYSRWFCLFEFTAFRSSINRNRIRDEREIHLQFMKSVSQESKMQVCPRVASRHGILSFYSPRALVNVRETERVLSDTEHRLLSKAHTEHCLDGELSLCIAQNMVCCYAQFWDYNYGIIWRWYPATSYLSSFSRCVFCLSACLIMNEYNLCQVASESVFDLVHTE